jgi:hypothetical protein
MTRQIVVDVIGDSSRFQRSTAGAIEKSEQMGRSFKGAAIAGAVAGVTMGVVTKAIDLAVGALSGASEAAKEDTVSQDRLALALKNTGKAQSLSTAEIEAAISANQRKGVSDSEQRQGISDFLDITKDATSAMALNTATVELAAAKGISYADAEGMIKSAAAGKTAALKKAGVEIEKGASITDIATAVNDKFGGSLEAVAETQGGKAAIANEKMGEAMETVGRIMNDIAITVMPVLIGAFADVVTWITNLVTTNQPLIDQVSGILRDAFEYISKVVLPALGSAINSIAKAVLPPLTEAFNFISTNVLPKVKVAFEFISKNVLPALGTAFGWIAKNVLPPLVSIASTIAGIFSNTLGVAFGVLTKTILPALGAAFGFITKDVLPPIGTGIDLVIKGAGLLGTAFKTLSSGVKTAWDGILGAIKSVINTIIRGWNSIKFTLPSVDLGPLGKIGGFTIGTPNIPYLHQGGIVPGVPGSDVLTMLQAGERVTARNQVGTGSGITIVVNGNIYGISGIDELSDLIAQRLRLAGA